MKRVNINKLIIEIIIMFAVSFGVMCAEGLFSTQESTDVFRIISDGLFAVGLLGVGFALLGWMGSDGQFDGIAFITKKVLSLKWTAFGDFREKYTDYKEKKTRHGLPIEMLISGAVCIAGAAVLLAFI